MFGESLTYDVKILTVEWMLQASTLLCTSMMDFLNLLSSQDIADVCAIKNSVCGHRPGTPGLTC